MSTQINNMSKDAIKEEVVKLIPELTSNKYKGQAGKVAVIGGCTEYTGAPYFAAYSALKVGVDLSHVFCTEGAATVIKCYSPELIVHPYVPSLAEAEREGASLSRDLQDKACTRACAAIDEWMDRFDVLVIGPGLGRDELVLSVVKKVISEACSKGAPMVLDADGLWLVNQAPELIKGYNKAILTPNAAEFVRLAKVLQVDPDSPTCLVDVCKQLQGPIVVQKGAVDRICDGRTTVECDEQGSLRRAGGQGDVLSGCIAAFVAWARRSGALDGTSSAPLPPLVAAAYGGSLVTRKASKAAFDLHGRAMGANDLIHELGKTIDTL